MRRLAAILLLMMVEGTIGCGGSSSAPTKPPPPPPPPVQLAEFHDPDSTFVTADVRDVQEQIVHFDVANNALIWTLTDQSFPGYPVSGNFVAEDKHFQIRFGTKDGQRRAYFTETASATICDIEVSGGQLMITGTNVKVPGT
jgi:hypothetical protein